MMRRMHIVGCPRSGTTLMMELMVTCFENDGYCDHEESIFQEPVGNPNLYLSKQPTDIRYLKRVFLLDPHLFVICMLRDPRSVITSIHKATPDLYFCNFRLWRQCYLSARTIEGHERFLSVRYEDLTADPESVQARIALRFPFLVKRHEFSKYESHAHPSVRSQNAMNGLRPITDSRQRIWEKHLPRLKAELERHPELAEALIECGYEEDKVWTEQLEKVQAREFKCRYSDRSLDLKNLETKIRKYWQSRAYIARHHLIT
jgi:Sulfotransferase family